MQSSNTGAGSLLHGVRAVNFNGRGRAVGPEKRTHHKGGEKVTSTAGAELSLNNNVV